MAEKTKPTPASGTIDTPTAIAAIVEPFKAAGGLLGFGIGFLATYRSGGAVTDAVLHGLLGAVLLFPVGWFLGLFLVREGIRARVDDQRASYEQRVEEKRREVMAQLQAGGFPQQAGLPDATAAPQLPRGDG